MRYGWAVLAGLALTTTALAQDVVGTYLGTYKVDMSKLKVEDQKMLQAMIDASKITMSIRKDKTFVVTITSINQSSRTEGTYRVVNGTLVTTDRRRNGEAVPDSSRRLTTFTISNGGRTLTAKLKKGPAPAQLVLTKKQ